jgi:tRNA wybutosine-synthesizing protein 1
MPTPHWAVWDAEEGGFDPKETRVRKVRNHPGKEAAEKAEDEHDKGMSEGCG